MNTSATLTMAELIKAADELAYLNFPVEARLSSLTLRSLRLLLMYDMYTSTELSEIYGIKLITDETLPPRRIEFRDNYDKVISSFDLPE